MCWDYDDPSDFDADQTKCCRCSEHGVGYNEDGDFLCEDCMFEEAVEQIMPSLVAGEEPNL